MALLALVPRYGLWHYTLGISDFIGVFKNILWFEYHFFSIPLLFQTLFTPWRRLKEERKRVFEIEDVLSVILVNIMMRLVGAVVRLATIAIGVFLMAATIVVGICLFLFWLIMPFTALLLVLAGFGILL